jgi:ankyrin repeat protein
MMATQRGTLMEGVVKSLLARNDVDPNIVNSKGEHVLMYSVLHQGRDIVKLLLDRPDIDVNFQAGCGSTALMWASRLQDPGMIKLLLDEEEIDVNRQDDLGRTALFMAASWNRPEAVKFLCIDIDGLTPLSSARRLGYTSVVNLLLEKEGH